MMSATSGSPRSKVFKYPRIAPWWEAKLRNEEGVVSLLAGIDGPSGRHAIYKQIAVTDYSVFVHRLRNCFLYQSNEAESRERNPTV